MYAPLFTVNLFGVPVTFTVPVGMYNPFNNILDTVQIIFAMIFMMGYTLKWAIPKVNVAMLFLLNVAVDMAFIASGLWRLQCMVAWSLLFWLVYYVTRSQSFSTRIYLAAFATLVGSMVWEIPGLMNTSSTVWINDVLVWWNSQGIEHAWAGNMVASIKNTCIPFLGWALYDLKYGWTKLGIAALASYILFCAVCFFNWRVFYYPYPFLEKLVMYGVRLPTVACFTLFIYGGLRNKRV